MKTLGFNSLLAVIPLLAVILASALQTRAEQNVSEDNIWDATPVHIADPSFAVENYFENSTNYESQGLSLATNIPVALGPSSFMCVPSARISSPSKLNALPESISGT
jgi:hypothetical protein